jgi:phosphoserine phosphatase
VGRCAVRTFALDDFLSSKFEVVDGRLTGRFEKPLCYHEGKVHYARRYAANHDIDLSKSYFYTDSNTDLPMLEAVGHPRIINPDPRLARIARKRDWIIGWGR